MIQTTKQEGTYASIRAFETLNASVRFTALTWTSNLASISPSYFLSLSTSCEARTAVTDLHKLVHQHDPPLDVSLVSSLSEVGVVTRTERGVPRSRASPDSSLVLRKQRSQLVVDGIDAGCVVDRYGLYGSELALVSTIMKAYRGLYAWRLVRRQFRQLAGPGYTAERHLLELFGKLMLVQHTDIPRTI